MKGRDVFVSPVLGGPFDGGKDVVVFFAKGGVSTNYLTLEWREKDSSRWLTAVPLSESWDYYVLSPEMFSFGKVRLSVKGDGLCRKMACNFVLVLRRVIHQFLRGDTSFG